MKIAAVSEDSVTISQHFSRAPFYVVVTVEDGRIVAREKRDKMGHAQFTGEPHGEEANGAGAYYRMEQAGIRPILTDIASTEQAVQAVISGQIEDHTEKLH